MPNDPAILLALLAAAVIEEIVFRAGVQETLLRWRMRRTGAASLAPLSMSNLLTASLFAGAHALLRSWPIGIAALPASLVLGWTYERSRRVWPCIALHAAFNLIWFFIAPLIPPAWLAP